MILRYMYYNRWKKKKKIILSILRQNIYSVRILIFPIFVISSEPMDISDFKIHMAFPCFRFPEIHLQ